MKYRFYSPVQGIIDYDFNKDMDYDSYFDEYNMEELEEIMLPEKYVGRAPQQTEDFLNHEVANALQKYEDLKVEQAEINV